MLNIAEAEFTQALAGRVIYLRQRRALSQQELADQAGVSRQVVYTIERGSRLARPSTIRKLARALRVKPEQLTTGETG